MAVISVNLTDTFEQWRTKTNSIGTKQGDLTTLTTTAKSTVVAAINELDGAASFSNVVEDTSPQLGGNLDVLARSITTSTTNGNIAITPHGSGKVVLDGISHPNADGTNGQVLQTNGSGVLSFATISSDPTMGGDLSGTASNAQIVANAVTATEIASNAVTTAKINADAVDGTKLADDACDSEHYTDGSIDNVHLATGIASSKLTGALPAISGASLTNLPLVGKNLIINGAMKIAQRGTSFAAMANGYSLDRWKFEHSNIGVYTITQDSSGPPGFANSLKIDCTTADASPAAGDFLQLKYRFEGQDVQHLKKGTSSAESVTLSFWVKCNKTGNFASRLYDDDNNRIIGSTVTINSANTWEKKSITYAGDTTGALDDDINTSLMIDWTFDAGSTYTSGAVPTSWETYTNADYAAGTTLALADSTSNYINITGVKLEIGTSATDFESRSYGEELKLCQRYYYAHIGPNQGSNQLIGKGAWNSATQLEATVHFKETMRTTPTLVTVSGTNYYRYHGRGTSAYISWVNIHAQQTNCASLYTTITGTLGLGANLVCTNANAYVHFNAEL